MPTRLAFPAAPVGTFPALRPTALPLVACALAVVVSLRDALAALSAVSFGPTRATARAALGARLPVVVDSDIASNLSTGRIPSPAATRQSVSSEGLTTPRSIREITA